MAPERIDSAARLRAAELIERYLADEMTGRQVAEAWPTSELDRALAEIGAEMLPEIHGEKLGGEFGEPRRAELRTVLARCRLFLLSDYPYAWSWVVVPGCATFLVGGAVVLLGLLTLIELVREEGYGALWFGIPTLFLVGVYLTLKEKRGRLRSMVHGDLVDWPFEREQDVPGADTPPE